MSGSSELKFIEKTEQNSETMRKVEELIKETELGKSELMNIFMTENDRVDFSNLRRKDREELRKKCATKK